MRILSISFFYLNFCLLSTFAKISSLAQILRFMLFSAIHDFLWWCEGNSQMRKQLIFKIGKSFGHQGFIQNCTFAILLFQNFKRNRKFTDQFVFNGLPNKWPHNVMNLFDCFRRKIFAWIKDFRLRCVLRNHTCSLYKIIMSGTEAGRFRRQRRLYHRSIRETQLPRRSRRNKGVHWKCYQYRKEAVFMSSS